MWCGAGSPASKTAKPRAMTTFASSRRIRPPVCQRGLLSAPARQLSPGRRRCCCVASDSDNHVRTARPRAALGQLERVVRLDVLGRSRFGPARRWLALPSGPQAAVWACAIFTVLLLPRADPSQPPAALSAVLVWSALFGGIGFALARRRESSLRLMAQLSPRDIQRLPDFIRQERSKLEVAATHTSPEPPQHRTRPHIPISVRKEVWDRHGGACAQCSESFDIQYDHIIPWSRGGASTAANLQILCGSCNRKKGATLG